MYIPRYQDLYAEDEEDQVYLGKIIKENLSRMPEWGGQCFGL